MKTPDRRPAPFYYPAPLQPRHRHASWQYGTKKAGQRIIATAVRKERAKVPNNLPPPPGEWDGPPGTWEGPPGWFDGPPGSWEGPPGLASGAPVKGLGCLPDVPDHRDRTFERFATEFEKQKGKLTEEAAAAFGLDHLSCLTGHWTEWQGQLAGLGAKLENRFHLGDLLDEAGAPRRLLPPIEDQGPVNSCSAHAVIGLVEYLVRAGGGEALDLSRLFLYKLSRMLDGSEGNTGTYLRSAFKALRLFGVPPEDYWPYAPELLDAEPQALQFAWAGNWKSTSYYRLDQDGFSGADTLNLMRLVLADRFPVAMGFSLFQSISQIGPDHVIPFPDGREGADRQLGSHAVLAVGYDDEVEVTSPCPVTPPVSAPARKGKKKSNGERTAALEKQRGALIVRNSWGPEWADWGYAYLPYRYVLDRLVVDCWTVLKADSLPAT